MTIMNRPVTMADTAVYPVDALYGGKKLLDFGR